LPRCSFRAERGVDRWQQHLLSSEAALLTGSPLLGDTSSKVRDGALLFGLVASLRASPYMRSLLTRLRVRQFVADRKPGVRHTWTWQHLATVCVDKGVGDGKRAPAVWRCALSAPGKDRFLICDHDKNVFGSFYHVRVRSTQRAVRLLLRLPHVQPHISFTHQEPESEDMQLSFADFVACASKWSTRKVLLRATLPCPGIVAHPRWQDDEATPPPMPPALVAELQHLVDWEWMRMAVQAPCRFGGILDTSLLACSAGGLLPARFMVFDTLLCQARLIMGVLRTQLLKCAALVLLVSQVSGRSRVLLIDPAHTYAGLYPYPVAHPYDGHSMVDFDSPDLGQWPRFASVTGKVTIMAPGDVLFIPRASWAHIQAMPDHSAVARAATEVTLLDIALHRGARARMPEAVGPYVGRVVEDLAATCEGVAGARDWLRRIAAGSERRMIDLATPLGYKRIRSATDIRDEIVLTIGDDADVHAFLEALTDGRMTPTPWLNVNFREPLYLKGVCRTSIHSAREMPVQ